MTYQRREEIFSKEVLNLNDIMELMGIPYSTAAELMRNMKRRNDRLKIQGKIHIQDYLEYFHLEGERYQTRHTEEVPY